MSHIQCPGLLRLSDDVAFRPESVQLYFTRETDTHVVHTIYFREGGGAFEISIPKPSNEPVANPSVPRVIPANSGLPAHSSLPHELLFTAEGAYSDTEDFMRSYPADAPVAYMPVSQPGALTDDSHDGIPRVTQMTASPVEAMAAEQTVQTMIVGLPPRGPLSKFLSSSPSAREQFIRREEAPRQEPVPPRKKKAKKPEQPPDSRAAPAQKATRVLASSKKKTARVHRADRIATNRDHHKGFHERDLIESSEDETTRE